MAKRQSDGLGRFIAQFELQATPHQAKVIRTRLDAGRQIYNALLGEALKRLDLYRQSRLYQRARRIPATQKRARADAFKAARDAWNWSEIGLQAFLQTYGQQFTHTWLNQHVDSQIVKKLAERAALTVIAYSFGKRGRPRFRRFGEMNSLEAINNIQSIVIRTDTVGGLCVRWGAGRGSERLELPLQVDLADPYHQHALAAIKLDSGFLGLCFTRVVRRVIRGRERFYAQVVLRGHPYQRDKLQRVGIVGLDLGPSTIAVVANGEASFDRFCTNLASKEREIRVLQRQIDRQRRANNPDCYDEQGRWIKGRRATVVSRRMHRSLAQLHTVQQQQTDHRKSLHGHLVRQVLALGSEIRMESLSYRAFQRSFGRSTGARAPGMFVSHLRRKAAEVGVIVTEFSPYKTRLSQTCHACGAIRKKPLSQRFHRCECGVSAHRDLYSAFLARYVTDDQLNRDQATADWQRFEPLLQA